VTARTDEPVARVAQNEAMVFEALLSVLAIDDGNVADHVALYQKFLIFGALGVALATFPKLKLRRSGGANVRRSALSSGFVRTRHYGDCHDFKGC
jgi:hypothetical protein